MGRQPRAHGAQVYCTSSPGDRQHRDATTNRTPHAIDFCAALNGYDKPSERVFCDHEACGLHGDGNVPDFFRCAEKFLADGLGSRARAN
jgi:hypothetical protein